MWFFGVWRFIPEAEGQSCHILSLQQKVGSEDQSPKHVVLAVVSGGFWHYFISASSGADGNVFPVFALDLVLCTVYLLAEACF